MRIWTAIFSCALMFFTLNAMAEIPGDSTGKLPNQIIAVQANDGFAAAMAQAKDALAKKGGLDTKQVLILGWIVKGQDVTIEVGAPNTIWPTSVFKTGEIHAQWNFFPDGVNGVQVGAVSYVDVPKTYYK